MAIDDSRRQADVRAVVRGSKKDRAEHGPSLSWICGRLPLIRLFLVWVSDDGGIRQMNGFDRPFDRVESKLVPRFREPDAKLVVVQSDAESIIRFH